MSKATSGIVLFSLLMALSLGVAFAEDEAAEESVVEINDTNVTNATNVTNVTNVTNITEDVEIVDDIEAQSS
ncbi:MAG TPA: hypothetical protein PLQ38_03845 [Methanothrix sp.]|nr:hypothetical protein [Methanothrix sp.]